MDRLNKCLSDIRPRVSANFLKLNSEKTELLLIGNPKRLPKINNFQLTIGDSTVKPSTSARNLGVTFDDVLSFKAFTLNLPLLQHFTFDLWPRFGTTYLVTLLAACEPP